MYFFNALTAVAKRGKEEGGKKPIRRGWVKLSVTYVASLGVQHPISQLFPWGRNLKHSPGKKCGGLRGICSILNNVSGQQMMLYIPLFLIQGLEGREKECCRMQNSLHVARQSKISMFLGVVMAETSHHYQKILSEELHAQSKFWSHIYRDVDCLLQQGQVTGV